MAGIVPAFPPFPPFFYIQSEQPIKITLFPQQGVALRLTNEQREQVITLRRSHSLSEVASLASRLLSGCRTVSKLIAKVIATPMNRGKLIAKVIV
ncbi:hypothetical protein ACET85_02165 [Aeromonas veronii]|uniref:hypothetical protein n=1 Tax=Aeromonas veronii TaxID=654 RepID=UPI00132FD0AE|nr:hypothetical protein [Aeromonas veronii]